MTTGFHICTFAYILQTLNKVFSYQQNRTVNSAEHLFQKSPHLNFAPLLILIWQSTLKLLLCMSLLFNINEGLGFLKLAAKVLSLINPSPCNVNTYL